MDNQIIIHLCLFFGHDYLFSHVLEHMHWSDKLPFRQLRAKVIAMLKTIQYPTNAAAEIQ